MTKQTCSNNAILRYVKKQCNAKMYARALKIVNESSTSIAIEYVLNFIHSDFHNVARANLRAMCSLATLNDDEIARERQTLLNVLARIVA